MKLNLIIIAFFYSAILVGQMSVENFKDECRQYWKIIDEPANFELDTLNKIEIYRLTYIPSFEPIRTVRLEFNYTDSILKVFGKSILTTQPISV